ncbi:hypothetical protein CCACVL1_06117 [Corchorus capsularis]|uniref:Uncharacterized protein n=1 Tax=Corchorus capsularis TaxID=210143 RepID=A0A1R3JHF7_COCAP|nr:hypothetical protein CCACVL1_06117 [Corchorus capsularis]
MEGRDAQLTVNDLSMDLLDEILSKAASNSASNYENATLASTAMWIASKEFPV